MYVIWHTKQHYSNSKTGKNDNMAIKRHMNIEQINKWHSINIDERAAPLPTRPQAWQKFVNLLRRRN